MKANFRHIAPIVVTLVLLVYLGAFADLHIVTTGVASFRERSRAAVDGLEPEIGPWKSQRKELDARARDFLKPNAESTLLYQHSGTLNQAFYSVIQVQDSRYMTGHAPPNCYPGNGYTISRQEQRRLKVGEFDIPLTEYDVQRPEPDGRVRRWTIQNFFIFPDGRFGASMSDLDDTAADYRKVMYGAAQVQLITSTILPRNGLTRDAIFETLVGSKSSLEMIRILRTGIPK